MAKVFSFHSWWNGDRQVSQIKEFSSEKKIPEEQSHVTVHVAKSYKDAEKQRQEELSKND